MGIKERQLFKGRVEEIDGGAEKGTWVWISWECQTYAVKQWHSGSDQTIESKGAGV